MSNKATDIVLGSYISLKGKIWKVIDKMHVKPGKGGAFIQATLKSIEGTKLEHRFSSSDTIDQVMVEKRSCQFSYKEKDMIVFTNTQTYETVEITADQVPAKTMELLNIFASENIDFSIEFADDVVIDVLLPNSIVVTVDQADPVTKGQTAASSYKNALIKSNVKIGVPPYIEAGDKIIVNPYGEKGIEFVQRA